MSATALSMRAVWTLIVAVLIAAAGTSYAEERGRIDGAVLRPDGSPLQGAVVVAVRESQTRPTHLGHKVEVATARSDDKGRYSFGKLAAGTYLVFVDETGSVVGKGPSVDLATLIEIVRVARIKGTAGKVSVMANKASHLMLRQVATVRVRGVARSGDRVVQDARVRLIPVGTKRTWVEETTVGEPTLGLTNARGEFDAGLHRAGHYEIVCETPQVRARVGAVELRGSEQPKHLSVQLGQIAVKVKILYANGDVARSASVYAWSSRSRSTMVHETEGKNETYTVPYLQPGKWRFTAYVGLIQATRELELRTEMEEPVVIRLPRTGCVRVRVVRPNRQRVASARVLVEGVSGTPSLGFEANTSGEVRLRLPPRKWRVGIAHGSSPGFDGDPSTIAVRVGEELTVVLTTPK